MSLEVKNIFINWNFDCLFLSTSTDFEILFYLKVFPWFDLNLTYLRRTHEVWYFLAIRNHIYFLLTLSIFYRFWDIWIKISRVWPWPSTCRGHFLSNFYWHFRSNSYRFCDNSGQTIDGRIKWSFLSPNGVDWRIARHNRSSRFACALIKEGEKLKKERTLIC